MSFDPAPYQVTAAIVQWAITVASFALLAFSICLIAAVLSAGSRGPAIVFGNLFSGLRDLADLSARRLWALAQLTIREAVRRRALLVFVVFAILFMFAGWFITNSNDRPELQTRVYVSFVLTAISWLILPVVLLLSCWGLPEDIKARSLHTVVTKPARRVEVVLGRMIGFILVGTGVLVVMGVVGYIWINRQVPTDVRQAYLICRVPVYGQLSYLDREGDPGSGVNTGDIWDFRSYVEGATKARGIWKFEGVTPEQVGDKLVLESKFEAFRTHKGNMGTGLLVQYGFYNPTTDLRVKVPAFEIHEFSENVQTIDRKLSQYDEVSKEMKSYDLYDDLVDNGTLTIEVQCLDAGQYLGMARPDLFIRMPDRPFWVGYSKALLGTWLMMALIVVLGVTASCFVKGPVATLLVFTFVLLGNTDFRVLMEQMIGGEFKGGGPFENWYRLIMHLNPQVAIEDGPLKVLMQSVDMLLLNFIWLMHQIIPDFTAFNMSPYVANGFDVTWNTALAPSLMTTLAFAIPCLFIGSFSLKLRELESK